MIRIVIKQLPGLSGLPDQEDGQWPWAWREVAPAYLSVHHTVRQAADLVSGSGGYCGQER
jgi:hypothetical protein